MNKTPKLRFKEFSGDWESKKLGTICDVTMGQSPSSSYYNEENIGLPLIQGNADVQDRKTAPRIYTSDITKTCDIGDIIMSVRAPVGAISKSIHNACIGRGVCSIKPKQSNEFIYQFLVKYEDKWSRISQGSTFESVNRTDITDTKVSIPSKEEQEKIASLLSLIDEKISLQSEKVEALKDYKTGMMQKIFSRELRFKDDDGRDYPEWEEKKLGNYIVEYKEKTTENNQYPPLTSSRKGLFLQSDYFDKQIASTDNTGYNIVPRNYFTYRHMSDDAMFFFNINNLVDNGIVSTLYPVFTTNDKLDSIFLRYYLNETNEFKKYSLLQKQGGSRTYMYLSKLKEFKIKLPTIEEQNKIVKLLVNLENKLDKEQEKLDYLNEYKKGLLQQMFV